MTGNSPATVGVPVTTPVAESKVRPSGSPVAANEVGDSLAVIA